MKEIENTVWSKPICMRWWKFASSKKRELVLHLFYNRLKIILLRV